MLGTKRYAYYYKLSDSLRFLEQNTSYTFFAAGAEAAVIRKAKRNTLKYGISTLAEGTEGFVGLNADKEPTLSSSSSVTYIAPLLKRIAQQQHNLNFKIVHEKSEKQNRYFSSKIGLNNLTRHLSTNKHFTYELEAGAVLKLKIFSSLSFSIASIKKLPSLQLFYPDSLLTGSIIIKYGVKDIKPVRYNEANANFSWYKFKSNTSVMLNAWVRQAALDYVARFQYSPYALSLGYRPVSGNIGKGFLASGKTFIFPFQSTVSFSTFVQNDKGKIIVNDKEANEKATNLNYTASFITSFGFPVNTEVSYNHSYYWIEQQRGHETISATNNFYSIRNKYRVQFNEDYYIGV